MNNPIGILQGRLSPPVDGRIQAFPGNNWEQEFFQAKEIGLELIDWIVEAEGLSENPLLSVDGEKAINNAISMSGVTIGAVCADFFMDRPLIRCSKLEQKERIRVLDILISRLNQFHIKYLEIPFIDNSAINSHSELLEIVRIIKPLCEKAYQAGVTLVFETSLPPEKFRDFLSYFDHPAAMANYDMGNSASLGYNPHEELNLYGDMVATVHVKDRVFHGKSVPLGEGDTDFSTCFSLLKDKNYTGPFFLQVARGSDEFEWTKMNLAWVKKFLG